jgi:hypothetical protein
MSEQEKTSPKPKKAFTLVIVIAVLFILIAFAVYAATAAMRAMARMQCSSNLKGVGLALWNYHEQYGTFPPAFTVDDAGNRLHSWRVLILPHIGYGDIYERIRLDEPWNSAHNAAFHDTIPDMYLCHAERRWHTIPWTRYQVIVGPDTLFPGAESRPLQGDSFHTLLVVESAYCVHWMSPLDLPVEALALGIPHKGGNFPALALGGTHDGGALVVMADGRVLSLNFETTPEELREMSRNPKIPPPTETDEP